MKIWLILAMVMIVLVLAVAYFCWSPTKLFYTTTDYPVVKIAEDNWRTIAAEIPPIDLNNLDKYPKRPREAWNNEEAKQLVTSMKSDWMQGWQGDNVWYNFPLMYHNNVIDEAEKICPKTIAILKQIPFVQIAGFSMLVPKSQLTPHTDKTGKQYGSMAFNMPLTPITSDTASLYILDSEYKHITGKAVIFDATQTHSADNRSDESRVILYMDFRT